MAEKEKVINQGNGLFEVTESIGEKEWKEAQDKALKKLVAKVQIKGFRKGSVPVEIAKRYVNPNDLINEAINEALQPMYNKALADSGIRPYTYPKINVTKVNDKGIEVVFTITSVPTVELGQYKDIHLKLDDVKVSTKDVNDAIDKLLKDNAELVLKDDGAVLGDTVIFDFKGYINGKEFEGGSADNYELVLGSNQFIPGFEDQLVGCKSETKVDVVVTFPEQYIKDLAGKEAKFACMIHEVKAKKEPVLDDDFVKTLNYKDVTTVKDLKDYEKKQIAAQKGKDANNKYLQDVINFICNNSKVVIADAVLDTEAHAKLDQTKAQIEQNGLTYDQYLQILGLTEDKLLENLKANAKNEITSSVVLDKIAQVEGLMISRKELDEFYENTAKVYNQSVDDVKKMYGANEQNLAVSLLNQKIVNFLKANNGPLSTQKKEAPKAEEAKEEKPVKKPAAKKATKKAK